MLARQPSESALRESEARLRGIIGSAMDAILTVDEAQRIILFNGAAERIFRCAASEAIGQPLDRFIPERFRTAHRGHIRTYGETGVTMRAMGTQRPLTALRADGEEFLMEAAISQVEVGGERLYTVILRDVTERQRAAETEARLRTAWKQERQIAEALQQSYLPRAMPQIPEFEFAASYRPAIQNERVGGDFYEVVLIDDRFVAFCIGDVSGKGLDAALYAAMARSMWRGFVTEETRPGPLLMRLNRALARYMELDHFVTMVCGLLDRSTGELQYAVAGHPEPLVRRANGGCEALLGGGIVLGVMPEFHYDTETTCLRVGDLLLLCTDGVTELRHEQEMLDVAGLRGWLADCPAEAAEAAIAILCRRAQDWSEYNFQDDVALVAIRCRSLSAATMTEAPLVSLWPAAKPSVRPPVLASAKRCA